MIISICEQEVQLECLVAIALFFVWIILIISERCFLPSTCNSKTKYIELDNDFSKITDYWGPNVISINREVRKLALLRDGNMGRYSEYHVPQTHVKKSTSFKAAGACVGMSDCFSNCGLNFAKRYNHSRQSVTSFMEKIWAYIVGFSGQIVSYIVSFFSMMATFSKLLVMRVFGSVVYIFIVIGSLIYFFIEGFFKMVLFVKGMCSFERTSVKETYQPQYRHGGSRRFRSYELKYGEIEDSFPVYHAEPNHLIQGSEEGKSKQSHVFGSFAGGASFQGHGKSQLSFGHLNSGAMTHDHEYPVGKKMHQEGGKEEIDEVDEKMAVSEQHAHKDDLTEENKANVKVGHHKGHHGWFHSSASLGAKAGAGVAFSTGFDLEHQKGGSGFKTLEKKTSSKKFIVK